MIAKCLFSVALAVGFCASASASTAESAIGAIDVAAEGWATFPVPRFVEDEDAVIGIRVLSAQCARATRFVLRLKLLSSRGDVVFDRTLDGETLTWSSAIGSDARFGYLRGEHVEKPMPDGDVENVPVHDGPDRARGTRFRPATKIAYTLHVKVEKRPECPTSMSLAVQQNLP